MLSILHTQMHTNRIAKYFQGTLFSRRAYLTSHENKFHKLLYRSRTTPYHTRKMVPITIDSRVKGIGNSIKLNQHLLYHACLGISHLKGVKQSKGQEESQE